MFRAFPQTAYLHHVKRLHISTHYSVRMARRPNLLMQASMQLSRRKFMGMKNVEKMILYHLRIPRWFQIYIYSLASLTTLEMLWCFYPAGPLPRPAFHLESLNVNFSEGCTLDLMDACRNTLSSLQLSTHELRSLDIARITEYPPPPLTHLHVNVFHLDADVQISRLLAACRKLTHLTITESTSRSGSITIGPRDLPKLEWFEGI